MISSLEELTDISHLLIFEPEPTIFNEEYATDFVETVFHLMDEYISQFPNVVSDPDFYNILLEEIHQLCYLQFEQHIMYSFNGDEDDDVMEELIEYAFSVYIDTFYPDKMIDYGDKVDEENIELSDNYISIIETKIQGLREMPQPEQRTDEWYKFRWNLITASNAWKAFESKSNVNQLIYEKCQPLKVNVETDEVKMVNLNTAMHWGQKYEPLSVMIYEGKFNTKVEDFGCIQHPKYTFIGASPDGIIVNKESTRYGRMLEIKNVVSREITGIPKKEYWVQMQLQMEVCDLDECDFLETKFIEYPDNLSFLNDRSSGYSDNLCLSEDDKMKGIVIHFHAKEGKPHYEYKPLHIVNKDDIEKWEDHVLDVYEKHPYNYIYMKTIYWKLEVISCVLILRNKEWFKSKVGQLENVWNIIESERVTGYEHRAPAKRNAKKATIDVVMPPTTGCLLPFMKIVKLDNT